MVDISKIQSEDEQSENGLLLKPKDLDELSEIRDSVSQARGEESVDSRTEEHEFEGTPFQSNIPGKVKFEGYKSQTNRDLGDTLEMLPDEVHTDGAFINTAEAVAKGNLTPEAAANEEQLDMEYFDTAAENYLRANAGEAFSPIQIAEDITPRDSLITEKAAEAALRDNYVSNGGQVRVEEVSELANNDDVVTYHAEGEEQDLAAAVRDDPTQDWINHLDEQQAERQSVGIDEALEYLAEENPEAMNELAIQYVAGEIEEELEKKDEYSRSEIVDSFERDTLEKAGAIGGEDYEVRGETFYAMTDEKMEELLS